jgi:hypothetical protein
LAGLCEERAATKDGADAVVTDRDVRRGGGVRDGGVALCPWTATVLTEERINASGWPALIFGASLAEQGRAPTGHCRADQTE